MEIAGISEKVKQFIFEYIDSVEQLEILLYMRISQDQWHNGDKIGRELRLSPISVNNRLSQLHNSELIVENSQLNGEYRYDPDSSANESVLIELSEAYRQRKHRILELIFSPAKKARKFANAFTIKQDPSDGDENG